MATAAVAATTIQPSFLHTAVGKKLVMAATGAILYGFVVAHMTGNLLIYVSRPAINDYSHFLHTVLHGAGLWIARAVLLSAVGLHLWAAVSLWGQSRAARPVAYAMTAPRESTFASRTMRYSGIVLLAYIVYHLLDLTIGAAHPGPYLPGDVYRNLVNSFRVVPVAVIYLVGNLCLGLHLYHGSWSFLQTLGLNHPRYNRLRKRVSMSLALLVVLGNLSFPVAVLTGVVR